MHLALFSSSSYRMLYQTIWGHMRKEGGVVLASDCRDLGRGGCGGYICEYRCLAAMRSGWTPQPCPEVEVIEVGEGDISTVQDFNRSPDAWWSLGGGPSAKVSGITDDEARTRGFREIGEWSKKNHNGVEKGSLHLVGNDPKLLRYLLSK